MKSNSHRGRRNMKNKTTLPLEVINQILLRLPVKSLVRFRCVCESWCSLISDDPHFAKSHFELTAAPARRLVFITASAPETRSIDLDAPLNDDSASAIVKLGTVDIWVMEEHSGHSSWTKTLVLAIDHIPTPAQYFFSPICSTECGDIVGTNGSIGLVKYNCKGQLLEHRSYSNDPHVPHERPVAMYTESLLSLPGGS